MNTQETMQQYINQLNQWSYEYYVLNNPTVSDKKWDEVYDKLKVLEDKTGIVLANSPTHRVSGEVANELVKVKHSEPMLSSDKSTNIEDIKNFIFKYYTNSTYHYDFDWVTSYKEDGLTIILRYKDGKFYQAVTRGDGYEGEDVTHNFKHCRNIPQIIPYTDYLEVRGEGVISWENFEKINTENGDIYTHPRNLASGAVRQLDSNIFENRCVDFLAFTLVNWKEVGVSTYMESLNWLENQGFTTVPHVLNLNVDVVKIVLDRTKYEYPTDGWIFRFNDLAYGESLGSTSHHPNYMIALKPDMQTVETTFRGIDYKVSRNGIVSLTAMFDDVVIDGATINRASVHNVDIFNSFKFGIGDKITTYKANEIIPQIDENLTKSGTYKLIDTCPCCGTKLKIAPPTETSKVNVLKCENPTCSAKQLAKFNHFVSKACMNIDGLSENTLEVLINNGFLHKFADIYQLSSVKDELIKLERFGKTKVDNLLNAIEDSRHVKLENYINALGIPNIGKSASKTISKYCNGNINTFIKLFRTNFDFSQLEDFGQTMNKAIYEYFSPKNNSFELASNLIQELDFIKEEAFVVDANDFINGKTFVVTGKFNTMPRNELEKIITNHGGKLSGSVSKKTDYLLTNDGESGSTKAEKAKSLNIPIMSEEEFLSKIN